MLEASRNEQKDQECLLRFIMVMAVKDHTKAKDGFELQFGANHLGYFLLTNLLVPKIIAAHRRFINVTSFGYMSGGVIFDDLSFKVYSAIPTPKSWPSELIHHRMEQHIIHGWHMPKSRTANILFTRSFVSKLRSKHVNSYALHPGRMCTMFN